MKLLVDENLAPELAAKLADLFPGSVHVSTIGLGSTSDTVIWEYAGANQFTFLTKDKDFVNLSITLGPPPKVGRSANGQLLDLTHRANHQSQRSSFLGIRGRRHAQPASS